MGLPCLDQIPILCVNRKLVLVSRPGRLLPARGIPHNYKVGSVADACDGYGGAAFIEGVDLFAVEPSNSGLHYHRISRGFKAISIGDEHARLIGGDSGDGEQN
jgi:hypothetical protein